MRDTSRAPASSREERLFDPSTVCAIATGTEHTSHTRSKPHGFQ